MVPARPEKTSLIASTVNQECRSDCPSDLSRFATRPSDQEVRWFQIYPQTALRAL